MCMCVSEPKTRPPRERFLIIFREASNLSLEAGRPERLRLGAAINFKGRGFIPFCETRSFRCAFRSASGN